MKSNQNSGRRKFIVQSTLAGSAMFLPGKHLANAFFTENNKATKNLEVHLFSKHLQFLNYHDMAEVTKEMGFDGLDLTVRPNGHVLPERVTDDLPMATEAIRKAGLTPQMFSSNIIDADNAVQRQVLKTAQQLGYRFYRPAWVRYTDKMSVLETVALVKDKFEQLTKLNKELNMTASYHNHSGHYFGGPIWDLHQVIQELPVELFGAQYDIMHATVEGAMNWEIGFELIKDHINTLVVKDFIWAKTNGKWNRVNVPMGTGMVDFKKYFSLLKKYNINVPFSIHVEHDLGGAEHGGKPTIQRKEVLRRIKNDLDFLKKSWAEAS